MKKYLALIICVCISILIQPGFSTAQSAGQWRHYFSHNYVTSMAMQKDTLWIGYDYGLEERIIPTGEYRILLPSSSGLNANFINSIQVDPSGNKWISVMKTEDVWNRYGLIKFNGNDWTVYTETDSGSPLYPVLFAVDSSGSIWIPGNNRLIRFDGNNWTTFNASDQGIKWESTFSLAIDKSGNKWIGTFGKLVKFNGAKWEYIIPSDTINSSINVITFDSKNNLWAGTKSAGLIKFDGSMWSVYNNSNSPLPGNSITALYADKKDNIWTGLGRPYPESKDSSYGLAKFDGKNWTGYNAANSGLPSNYVTAITGDLFGSIWVGTFDKSYARFDGTNWQTFNSSNSSLPAINITSVVTDPKGNKWFTSENGLTELEGNSWKLYDKSNSGLPDNFVNAVAFDSSGNKWIGTKSGLVKYDSNSWSVYDTSTSDLPWDFIWSVAVDHKGTIWLGSSVFQPSSYSAGGLVRFDGMNWKVFSTANSILPSNVVNIIKIDSYGNKWFVYSGMDDYGDSPLQLFGLFKIIDTLWINYLDYGGLPIYAAEFDRK
ncbi:MAG: two-component regulator propeller domain-containing protein, partial [Acidobacteriota bacterium]